MRYGLPYMGSKNAIAKKIIDALPAADTFVDLFAGGCAVTHAAMMSGKYKRFIVNDISDAPSLFVDAVNGKFANETRWISREDIFRLKIAEPYVRMCWSFGNNGRSYLYSREIESFKKALYYAIVFNDYSLIDEYDTGIKALFSAGKSIKENRLAWQREAKRFVKRLQSLQSFKALKVIQGDYRDVKIPRGAVVYCDIPYRGTKTYVGAEDFSHDKFYEWALSRPFDVYISEYDMHAQFARVFECPKRSLLAGQNGSGKLMTERLFCNRRQARLRGDSGQFMLFPHDCAVMPHAADNISPARRAADGVSSLAR